MPNDDLTDAKIGKAETEIKIVRLEGKIDTAVATLVGEIRSIGDKISSDHEYAKTTRWALIGILVGGFFAVAGLIVTMAVYGDALFGRGMNVRDVVQAVAKEQQLLQERNQMPPTPRLDIPLKRM